MVLRLQGPDLSWTWIYIQANKDLTCQSISCTNFIIRYDQHFYLNSCLQSSCNTFSDPSVKPRPDFCRRRPAASPSSRHLVQIIQTSPSRRLAARTSALKLVNGRGRLTVVVKGQAPEQEGSLSRIFTVRCAPLPKATGLLIWVVALISSRLPTAPPPPVPLHSRRSSWWMCMNTCPRLAPLLLVTPIQQRSSPATSPLPSPPPEPPI